MMSQQLLRRLLVFALVAMSAACAFRSAHISDLQQHPGRYEDRTVTLNGVVTDSYGISVLPYRYYRIDDGTGQIAVLSQSLRRMPGKGDRVRVKGRVGRVAAFGDRDFGLHLREEDLDIKR